MDNEINLGLFVEYSAIFNDEPKDFREYLKGIDRNYLLEVIAHFLAMSNSKSRFEKYEDLIQMFFSSENHAFMLEAFGKLRELESRNEAPLILINPITTLKIFEHCFERVNGTKRTLTKSEIERNLFKAILVVNQDNTKLQERASTTTEKFKSKLEFYWSVYFLSQSYPYSELVNHNLKQITVSQFIKSIFLFEFLEINSQTVFILKKFLTQFECDNWKEFLIKYFPIIIAISSENNENHLNIVLNEDENFEKNFKFLEMLAVDEEENFKYSDFKALRNKPYYLVNKSVFRIIYNLFAAELIHKGLFFKLSDINRSLVKSERVTGDFRGFYCDNFSEKYLLYNILNSIYQNRYLEFSGEQMKSLGYKAEPDYYIRKGNRLLLFESKDVLIKSDLKVSYDFNTYEKVFKEKFYFNVLENGKTENKAVLQLINNIRKILKREFSFDDNYKSTSIKIYPILVVHDHQFNVLGLNKLINFWFKSELMKLSEEGLNIEKVRNITIIDIDTLIIYQDIFKSRNLKLEDCIDSYFNAVNFEKVKNFKSKTDFIEKVMKMTSPFQHHLSNLASKLELNKYPNMLRQKGFSLFD